MSEEHSRPRADLMGAIFQIEYLCDRFESALCAGDGRTAREFLVAEGYDAATAPARLLRELEELEAAYRGRGQADPDRGITVAAGPLPFPGAPEIPGYVIVGELGRGGMGIVYRAEEPALGREVAVKVLKPELAASGSAPARFLREARAIAAITHDHVVPIHRVGDAGGTPYMVMPMLAGESLEARLTRSGPLLPGELTRIGREAALGLAAAHAVGLVHRDVKPANLWLEAPADRVKVLDFGLARMPDRADRLTLSGAVFGTPAYMAPEQADGDGVDGRADLFALGAVLYRAATGKTAFEGRTLTAILRAVTEHHPPPPHLVNPAVPPALSALVMRLLAKNPADRPGSACQVANELLRLAGASGAPAADTVTVQVPPADRRARRCLAAGLALVLVGVAVAVWGTVRPERSSTDAEALPVAQPPRAGAAAPIRGSVDLLVYRTDRTDSDVLVPLSHPLALPLREGDHFKVVAEVDRPAYLYLFWVDENGQGVPVYPWTPGAWGTRPAAEEQVTKLNLVAPNGKGFQITGNGKGMETILMLIRSERLEASEAEIKDWFADLKPLPFRGDEARVWFENFDVLVADAHRGFKYGGNVSEPTGPRGLQLSLKQKIGANAEFSRAISFSRTGNQ